MVLKAAPPPKRQRVANAITESIVNGQLPPGGRLATVREMSTYFEVSPSVIHRALKDLVDDGMIECRGAQGFYVCEGMNPPASAAEPAAVATEVPTDSRVFLSLGHHSDLVWQLPYAGYDAIREKQFDTLLRHLDRHENCHIYVEQAELLRRYLDAHPEILEKFRAAAASGRLALTGGDSIPDLNLCCGESLVRNLQAGRAYYRDTFGVEVRIACENDAFGMCAQLPQILVKSGYEFLLPGRRPAFPREVPGNVPFRWRGADGSEIIVTPATEFVSHIGYSINLPVVHSELEQLRESILEVRNSDYPGDIFVQYMTELEPLREEIFGIVDAANRADGVRMVEFGSVYDYCARIDARKIPVVHGEFNPTFTGCYTTRIGVKQAVRRVENLLFAAEMLAAGVGCTVDCREAWHDLSLASFHDAVCGCHTDAANLDIMAKLTSAQAFAEETLARCGGQTGSGFRVMQPAAEDGPALVEFTSSQDLRIGDFPVQRTGDTLAFVAPLPGCGIAAFDAAPGAMEPELPCGAEFATDWFKVDFSTPHPLIRRSGMDSQSCLNPGFGEIIFRHETGSMWSEELQSPWFGRAHTRETVQSIQRGAVFYRVVTEGEALPFPSKNGALEPCWAGFGSLKFRKEYRFFHTLDYFTLKLTLEWRGSNTKIALRLPLALDPANTQFLCDVPFGAQARQPYFEVPRQLAAQRRVFTAETYRHAAGDWPVLHWVDCADDAAALAVANDGVPGWQWNAGALLASLLRSGTKIADGMMQPQPGALDNGIHEYEFAFRPHSPLEPETAPALGRVLNRKPVAFPGLGKVDGEARRMVEFNRANLTLSSLRRVDGGWVVRVYENLGHRTQACLRSDYGAFQLFESDLTEREWVVCDSRNLSFKPLEIKTLKLVFDEGRKMLE